MFGKYMPRPYGYAVAEAMRQSYYIPAPEPDIHANGPLTVQVLNTAPAVAATTQQETATYTLPIEVDTSRSYRVVRFEAYGPASQFLAIKDNGDKPRMVGFHVAVKTHHRGIKDSETFANMRLELQPMPPLRPDGMYVCVYI